MKIPPPIARLAFILSPWGEEMVRGKAIFKVTSHDRFDSHEPRKLIIPLHPPLEKGDGRIGFM